MQYPDEPAPVPRRPSPLRLAILLGIMLVLADRSLGGVPPFVSPSPKEKCAVCGMFVAKYANWVAQLVLSDGSRLAFDGPKDLFRCYFDLKRYRPGRSAADVAAVYVTDYYDLKQIDGQAAYYVVGSDVFGPMGKELVPFRQREAAAEFLRDHHGREILRFGDVPARLKALDE